MMERNNIWKDTVFNMTYWSLKIIFVRFLGHSDKFWIYKLFWTLLSADKKMEKVDESPKFLDFKRKGLTLSLI